MTGLYPHGLMVEELFAPQMRCSYPSKVCLNPRAVKLCGSLHKLCEFHRKKANTNQKRLQQRRRVIRSQMASHSPFGSAFNGPAMKVDLIQLLKSDSQLAYKDDFSVFEASFLDSLMYTNSGNGAGVNQVVQQSASTGIYQSYDAASDQAQAKYETFNFELRL